MPFLCVITPIFDGAYDCIKLLVGALKEQTCQDFIHVSVSNGCSPKIKDYLALQDPKYIYCELPPVSNSKLYQLIADLGRRREYCLKNYDADRYLFLDADIKIRANIYFQKLKDEHATAPVLLTKVSCRGSIFPLFPHDVMGHIDIANYSFNKRLAKTCNYPTDYSPDYGCANDYRFFENFKKYPFKLLDFISAEKDGNNNYRRVSEHPL